MNAKQNDAKVVGAKPVAASIFPQITRVLQSLSTEIKELRKNRGLPTSFQCVGMAMNTIGDQIGAELQYLTPDCRENLISLIDMAVTRLMADSVIVLEKHARDSSADLFNDIDARINRARLIKKMEEENQPPRAGRDECG